MRYSDCNTGKKRVSRRKTTYPSAANSESESDTFIMALPSMTKLVIHRRRRCHHKNIVPILSIIITACWIMTLTSLSCVESFSYTLNSQRSAILGTGMKNRYSRSSRLQQQQQQQHPLNMVMSSPNRVVTEKTKTGTAAAPSSKAQDFSSKSSNGSSSSNKGSKSPVSASTSASVTSTSTSSSSDKQSKNRNRNNKSDNNNNPNNSNHKRKKKRYQRKRSRPRSEEVMGKLRKLRQAKYEEVMNSETVNIWDFESLFPEPVWDYEIINRDLNEVTERDLKASITRKKKIQNNDILSQVEARKGARSTTTTKTDEILRKSMAKVKPKIFSNATETYRTTGTSGESVSSTAGAANPANGTNIDRPLTRMVEDRMYGFRRDQMGDFEYDTSLMGDGAVKFRDGVRLGNALKVNIDRLNYFAKKELSHGKLEEAEQFYEEAITMEPRDGRAYLGLSRIAQRRRDFVYAKKCLQTGINNSLVGGTPSGMDGVKVNDSGGNPFLLQALGTLEERLGHLSEAEKLYIASAKSRPSHAAAWVALAQLRTRKLRQGPNAGRMCYITAELELKRAGMPQSSHVYTAWAALEWKVGEIGKARALFKKALDIDPKCSAAWNQLGVMETQEENWDDAKRCFETVLKFDRRNSRVLQAYAIMETKNPEGNSREAIGLFEKALKANPRDGGVLQAYALYVAKLGDIDSARSL